MVIIQKVRVETLDNFMNKYGKKGVRYMVHKICFAASSGGHLEEISRLQCLKKEYDCFLFTEKGDFKTLSFCDKVYFVRQINRQDFGFIFRFLELVMRSFKVLFVERPDCIISTGALATFPLCFLGKLMNIKIIYIESLARINGISKTGGYMKRIADLYIVQWEDLLKFVPGAMYGGSIF